MSDAIGITPVDELKSEVMLSEKARLKEAEKRASLYWGLGAMNIA